MPDLELEPPDRYYYSSVIGWLELGNPAEARREWEQISQANRGHPAVLDAAWRIHAATKSWASALEVAGQQVKAAPDQPAGWINQSFALHEMKRTQEAFDQLLPLAKRFPAVSIIHYNLACYACQLDRPDEAKKNLARAIQSRSKDEIKAMALADADLKPIWDYIKAL